MIVKFMRVTVSSAPKGVENSWTTFVKFTISLNSNANSSRNTTDPVVLLEKIELIYYTKAGRPEDCGKVERVMP
jgi:hypothetical protein